MKKDQNTTPGHAFRAAVLDNYETDSPIDLVLLDEAAAMLDEMAALQVALEDDGVIVKGARGQDVAHPALKALRDHRAAFLRLCERLEPNGAPTARKAAATLASRRWGR